MDAQFKTIDTDLEHRTYLSERSQERVGVGLLQQGYAFAKQCDFDLEAASRDGLQDFRVAYQSFPNDPHLNPGEGERNRTYARFKFTPSSGAISLYEHTQFFQSATFDHLYGDIHRSFAAVPQEIMANRFFLRSIVEDFFVFPKPQHHHDIHWEISCHLIRIAAVAGNRRGRPAPEGIHQDGYHFGVARLFDRYNVKGAESRVYNLERRLIDRAYLTKPLDTLYMNDRSIFHSVEAFCAANPSLPAHRDMLITLYQPVAESPQPKVPAAPLIGIPYPLSPWS